MAFNLDTRFPARWGAERRAFAPHKTSPTTVAYSGCATCSGRSAKPFGCATRTGKWKDCSVSSGSPWRRAPPPARTNPAGTWPSRPARCKSSRINESNSMARGSMMSVNMCAKMVRGGRSPTLAISIEPFPCMKAVAALQSFGFRDGCAQADGQVIRKVIAANRNSAAMTHHAAAKDEQFRGAAADVQQAAAEIAFVLRERGFRGSKWFENRIVDKNAGLVRGGDEILRGGNGGSHQMDVDFQALADHADGVAYAVLRIHHEFVRKDVEDFAVFGKRDVASGVHGAAHVFALDVSRPMSKGDAAAAVYAADVAAGDAN